MTQHDNTGYDERYLISKAKRGDCVAFECLYRTHVDRVYALCMRLCANAAQAEDATQESFIRAWHALPRFKGFSTFSTWLHRIAVNTTLEQLRKEHRRNSGMQPYPEQDVATQEHRTMIDKLDLETALAQLPDGARTVFVLHDVEGYRHHEIAKMTGTAVGTSKAHLHRARQLLREMLAQ